ncbi:MAG TPA: hypothetical protein VM186_11515 [Planctomycetota bacterium]|nr:hypothetical protein [Planctomycetota bacterium]
MLGSMGPWELIIVGGFALAVMAAVGIVVLVVLLVRKKDKG